MPRFHTDLKERRKVGRVLFHIETVNMMERAVKRLEYAIMTYRQTGLADEAVDFNLTQAIETLRKAKSDLGLVT